MKTLSADDIFATKDIAIEPVDVPEWGGRVHVREFSAAHREQFEALLTGDADDGDETARADLRNVRCRVVALTACDEAGRLLFTVEQAEQLALKSDRAIDRVYDAAARLNKLRKKDRDAEKKGSAGPRPDGSPTA